MTAPEPLEPLRPDWLDQVEQQPKPHGVGCMIGLLGCLIAGVLVVALVVILVALAAP